MTEIGPFQFLDAESDASDNLALDPKLALLAVCVVNQQRFTNTIDLRQAKCLKCGAVGYNTGWGFWRFTCGAGIFPDGEFAAPCGATPGETR